MSLPLPPTGIYTTVFRNKAEIRWVGNSESDIKGYNVYNSTTSGGGISGYVKLNNSLIETYEQIKKRVTSSQTIIVENGANRTTTVQETFVEDYIYEYTHDGLTTNTRQFYVVTAVNAIGEESPYSIEVDAIPLIINTEIVADPLRTQNDVSLDYITTLLSRAPKLDVKPASVTRQLHIDPNSKEFAYAYVKIDFIKRAQSFITLNALDDADGDRISDPVSTSPYKQLLKEAYFFTNDADVQSLIDFAYDQLAADTGTYREPATKSSTTITFYTATAPTVDLTVPLNTSVSTVPSEITPAVEFLTLSSAIMEVAHIENYYSQARQRYELNLPIEAVIAGAVGNVNAGSIINTSIAGLQVVNLNSAFGGTDQESNADLADRAQLAFVGLDVGTSAGYKKTVTKIPNVTDVIIVDAGNPLMQRDYDDVRHKHVYGKVDIYIRGGILTQQQDTIGFLFKELIDETMNIIDSFDMIIQTSNSNVSITHPIFAVRDITNVTKGKEYDLSGNWTILKNGIEMIKITEVSTNLTTGLATFVSPLVAGDVITANYDYKVLVEGEVVIDPALGGEVNFTLNFFPIVKHSYTIYKNGTALVETTNYTLNLTNGFLQLTAGLAPGDALTATYKYVIPITNEIVISSAVGGEIEAQLANANVLESLTIESDGVTLDLEHTNAINASIGMNIVDIISSTFRYRDSDPILLLKQPADSIISVESSTSGILEEGVNYTFNKNDDILLNGNSAKAQRTLQITYGNNKPVGTLQTTSENIVLINNEYTELVQPGIDVESIIVKDNTKTYLKHVDYLIKEEQNGSNIMIARSVTSTIPNGGTVIVSYEYGELITILYNVNPLIEEVQTKIEDVRHVTADVLVKGVLETKIDFTISVVIKSGSDPVAVTNDIRTAINNELLKRRLSQGVAQSDIIRVIEEVVNVESVLVPLTKMAKANGTQINREFLNVPFTLYQSSVVDSYTTGPNVLLQKTLGSNAGDGFYAIFEDDRSLKLVTNANDVDSAAGQGFISSNGEVIISTINSDPPDTHSYTVSYVVNGETGAKDIVISDLEFISTGEVVISTAFAA